MDKSLISQAIQSLELLDIYIYSSSINRFKDITASDYPDDMFQQSKLSISAELLKPVDAKDNQDNKIIINAKVSLGVRLGIENDEEEVTVLSEIEACYVAKYIQNSALSEEAVSEFMKYNVIHNVWPFWREHALRNSAEARLPLPRIPLFKEQPTSDYPS